ncbi:SURF1 family protein [Sphingomonas nostoxanthinifaciens]|uniref:SURF1 family protein n=1 Tax=Sphingomonas nostoxanthinifaciens TaxID=2872652 RepID=UPI001CC1FA97|nr:SURF1 family protein [Sphingomonas nostoxanthinifaciens]UAK24743.1 SURF1 family protein [Sphingomonas nostoxanthinifaciens]
MSRRIPIVPTIIVIAAALLMVRLGVWQLQRLHEKAALATRYAANVARPPLPLAALFPVSDDALFRRTSAMCLSVVHWSAEAGRTAAGTPGWRHIASCRTGAEGPGFAADMGVSQESSAPAWNGGVVRGRLTWAPNATPLVARLFGAAPASVPMIVGETAAPGLQPSAQPDPAAMPNNHLAYAVQWFLFAGVALVIYALLLWRRTRRARLP